jgi:DNA-binding transcriptional regulator/RsmH inhibitor MraZ
LAGLSKSVLVIGVDQIIEIWAPERYEAFLDNFGQTYEEVAEELPRNE